MIQPNELRIGNYVHAHGGNDVTFGNPGQPKFLAKITSLANDYMAWEVMDEGMPHYYHKDISPVHLTEEWLLKFGFEDNSYAVFHKTFNGSEYIAVTFDDYAHTKLSERPVDVSDYSVTLPVKYVHQLQNLYFALTGTELTIKE